MPIRPPIPERVNFRRELGDLISLPPKTLRRLQRAVNGCYDLASNWAAGDVANGGFWRLMIIADLPSGQISCLGLVPNHRDRLYALTAYQCDYRGQPDPWKSARIFFFDNGVIVKHHHRSPRPLLPEEKKEDYW